MFAANVPPLERLARLLLGLVAAACALCGLAQPSLVAAALGLCLAATGLVGFCPACALAGRRLTPRR
jgi:DUF2892 family protein